MEILLYIFAALVIFNAARSIYQDHCTIKTNRRLQHEYKLRNQLLNLLYDLNIQSAVPPIQLKDYRKPGPRK